MEKHAAPALRQGHDYAQDSISDVSIVQVRPGTCMGHEHQVPARQLVQEISKRVARKLYFSYTEWQQGTKFNTFAVVVN